jgi:hypothetical protein
MERGTSIQFRLIASTCLTCLLLFFCTQYMFDTVSISPILPFMLLSYDVYDYIFFDFLLLSYYDTCMCLKCEMNR